MQAAAPSTRTIVRIFVTVAALLGAAGLLYEIRTVLGLLAVSLFVAVALGPAVDLLVRRRTPRWLAILAVYLAIFAAIAGIAVLFVPSVSNGVNSLARNGPHFIDRLRRDATFRNYDNRYKITSNLNQAVSTLPGKLGQAAGTLGSVTVGVFSAIVKLITVLTIAFFLLLYGGRYLELLLGLVPPERAPRLRLLAQRIYRSVAGYVAGNLAISVFAGLVSFLTLKILGIPYALPLSILMGFFDLIPLVGATIGAIIVGFVTLAHGFPTSTIVWAVVQVAYQQVESNVIFPVVYRRTVHVNGLVTIVAVIVGAQLLGILGALLAIPVAGATQIVGQELWHARHAAHRQADATVTATAGGSQGPG